MSGFAIALSIFVIWHLINNRSKGYEPTVGETIIVFCSIYACISIGWDFIKDFVFRYNNIHNTIQTFAVSINMSFQNFGIVLTFRGSWIPIAILFTYKNKNRTKRHTFNNIIGILFGVVLSGNNLLFFILDKVFQKYNIS
jgi:hypothetical protein